MVMLLEKIDILALSNLEKFNAVRQMPFGINWMRDRWYLFIALIAVVVLFIILNLMRKRALARQMQLSKSVFESNCDRRGLSSSQRELARKIAEHSGDLTAGQIFISSEIFDTGSARLMNFYFKSGMSLDDRKAQNAKIKQLRDMLGYTKSSLSLHVKSRKSRNITSRHVSVGRRVNLIGAGDDPVRLDAEIIKNNSLELWLKPLTSVQVEPGQVWRMYYHLGASVWEFSCYLIGVESGNLIFDHSDHVKFINRRRFRRVSVNIDCWVSKFNCSSIFKEQCHNQAPEFTPAKVIEVSGPGLKILCELNINIGDRIVVSGELIKGRLIQDVAEVRHVRGLDEGRLIAVELIGVDEETTDALVRETNRMARKVEFNQREIIEMSSS